jgi:Family of unknown function (DUF6412)
MRYPAEVAVVVLRALAAVTAQLAGCWQPASHLLTTPSGLMALAALALTGMVIAILVRADRIAAAVTGRPLISRVKALRRKAWCAVYQRQLNPDAAGHARPRAPSAAPAAA